MILSKIKFHKSYIGIYLIIFSLLLLEFVGGISNSSWITFIFGWQLIFIWLFCFIKAFKKYGLIEIYTLLLLTSFLFLYSQVFSCLLINSDEYKYMTGIVSYKYSEQTLQKAFLCNMLFLITSDFVYSTFQRSKGMQHFQILERDNTREWVGILIIKIFVAFAIIRAILEIKALSENRLILFKEGGVELPMYVRLGSTCFKVGYMILLSSMPLRKVFVKYTIVYFILIVPSIIVGNRMQLAVFVLFVFWYNHKFYNINLHGGKIIIGGILSILLLQLIAFSRSKVDVGEFGFIEIYKIFLESQAISFNVLPLLIDYIDKIDFPYPAVFDSAISGIVSSPGQSLEVLSTRASLGHQLVYTVNPNYYLSGASLGTSYVAELAQLHFLGVGLGAVFLGCYIGFFEKKVLTNRYVAMFMLMFFSDIISSPRGSLMPSVYIIIKELLFYFVLFNVFKQFYNRNNLMNKQV